MPLVTAELGLRSRGAGARPEPSGQVVSTLDWPTRSTPQVTIPVTINGHKFLIEIDEFGSGDKIGAARIIDIPDDTKPFVISNIKLEVNMPQNQPDQLNDPERDDFSGRGRRLRRGAHGRASPTSSARPGVPRPSTKTPVASQLLAPALHRA